ncbi:hypothetical protein ABHN98_16420 [Pseudomonas syringae]
MADPLPARILAAGFLESKKPLQPEGGSGQGMCLKESVHEQGDQDDDRDWNAEEKQQ